MLNAVGKMAKAAVLHVLSMLDVLHCKGLQTERFSLLLVKSISLVKVLQA